MYKHQCLPSRQKLQRRFRKVPGYVNQWQHIVKSKGKADLEGALITEEELAMIDAGKLQVYKLNNSYVEPKQPKIVHIQYSIRPTIEPLSNEQLNKTQRGILKVVFQNSGNRSRPGLTAHKGQPINKFPQYFFP